MHRGPMQHRQRRAGRQRRRAREIDMISVWLLSERGVNRLEDLIAADNDGET